MGFEQKYGSLSYTDGLPDYRGLPLEQIDKTFEVLDQKYQINLQKWSKLKSNITNSAILNSEQASIDKALAKANQDMHNIVTTGNFHLADVAVEDAINNFSQDKDMKAAFNKRASKEAFITELDKNDKINAYDKSRLKRLWDTKNQNYTHYDETGMLVNGVQSIIPAEDVDVAKKWVDLAQHLQKSDFNAYETVQGINAKMKERGIENVAEYYKFLTSHQGVSDPRELAVMQMVMNDPAVQRYYQQKIQLDMIDEFGVYDQNKGANKLNPNGSIMYKPLSDDYLYKNGIEFNEDRTKLIGFTFKQNAKGQYLTDKGTVTNNYLEAEKLPNKEYSVDPNNPQGAYYNAIMDKRYKQIQTTNNNFAQAYAYDQSTYEYKESPYKALKEHQLIKKDDNIPVITSSLAENITGGEQLANKMQIENVISNITQNGMREALKFFTTNGTVPTSNLDWVKQIPSIQTLQKEAKYTTDKGKAARTILNGLQSIRQENLDNNNEYQSTLLGSLDNLKSVYPWITSNGIKTYQTTLNNLSNRFNETGAPLNYTTPDGKLTDVATNYCIMHGISPTMANFKQTLKITDNEFNMSLNALKTVSPKMQVLKNVPVYTEQWQGTLTVPEKDLREVLKWSSSELMKDPNTYVDIIQGVPAPGFTSGKKATIGNITNYYSKHYSLDETLINGQIQATINDGKVRTLTTEDGKKIFFSLNPAVNTGKNGNFVPIEIKVVDKNNVQESGMKVGLSVGTGPRNNIRSSIFKPFEDKHRMNNIAIKAIQQEHRDIQSDLITLPNGQTVPQMRYSNSDECFYFLHKVVGENSQYDERTFEGQRYYKITNTDEATEYYNRIHTQ